MQKSGNSINPWRWVPSLYFAEGLPYVIVMTLSVMMYKRMGLGNAELAFYTGWLYLPWVVKPLWSPFVDIVRSKRWWVVAMQLLIGAGMAGVALTIPTSHYVQYTLAFMWLMAFGSATHDISADGFYMLGLSEHHQSLFVGIRSTFYRFAMIAGQGLLIMFAGYVERTSGSIPFAWSLTFYVCAGLLLALGVYHALALPRPATDGRVSVRGNPLAGFVRSFATFFRKPQALAAVSFMLLYRLPEALLAKMSMPFLVDSYADGGLQLSTEAVGFVQGTVGIVGLVLGGILGGVAVSRGGLRRWLWPMVCAITLPDAVYVGLSFWPHVGLWLVNVCVFVEQFGYGFGFTAYTLYLIYYARGNQPTSHYALGTAFMAIGMMLPGMVAGWLQQQLGYRWFFLLVMACCAVTFVVTARLRIDPGFGKRKA